MDARARYDEIADDLAAQNADVVLETGENTVVYRDEERAQWFAQRA